MWRPSRRAVRVTAVAVVLLGVGLLGQSALSTGASVDLEPRINASEVSTEPIPEGAEITVIATQGFFLSDENAELTAITRNGTVVYHDATYRVYFDVDPVTGREHTVEYVASAQLDGEACSEFRASRCTRNVIERANLSTGEVTRVFATKTPRITATRWHDVDRLNDTHVVIADIYRDSVRIVNVTSGETTWEWNATNIYDYEGEQRPQDWTHLNDVEVVGDRTFMLSMRNMDEVVFVRRGEGYLPNMTLGEEDDHGTLFEQHNPDYIPEERGGPAIVVGDSENNRIAEYQRVDGEWNRTWTWRDARMQWPRDADRLPNGRTLVVDSHGDRVMELTPTGSVAWEVYVGMPYDVERLGTGDESSGGESIRGMSVLVDGGIKGGWVGRAMITLKDALPATWVNSALYVGPSWFLFRDLVTVTATLLTLGLWGAVEYRWASWSVTGVARASWRRVFGRF